ncbi:MULTISPECIES: DUF4438 domain-containing protein [unclassified Caballeronia]|uniref:DUF4438 domain-containing protein n=1 Tax=unclassified Caballeronia TaxID=2646786 RepID=UPI0020299E82|nr:MULTISPECIES: DUF4438 domain-containing protein [unclassified Caballeronia]
MPSELATTRAGTPRINTDELVAAAVIGQIAHPVGRASAYRIGYDGVPRVLHGTGGIALNKRIGDACVGLASDHTEPGVALHNNGREIVGPRDGPNNALLTYACVGNAVHVISGPCEGRIGLVTGKHGGVNHVLVDFPTEVLRRLRIGDRMQVHSVGPGMRLTEHPDIDVFNASPALIRRWGLVERDGKLGVPVTHLVPAHVMGSGLGKNTAWRGDYDIQLADRQTRERYRLGSLRFGDMVAIMHADARRGPLFRSGFVTIGVVVHGDSTVSGHGPGVTPLLSGSLSSIRPIHAPQANLAEIFDVRRAVPPRARPTLIEATSPRPRRGDPAAITHGKPDRDRHEPLRR